MAVEYLFIVRHGDTKANEKGIDAGPLDYPLNRKGLKDAAFIAKTLSKPKVDAVYSSPVFRAVETAKIVAKPHKLKVRLLEELTEAKLRARFVGKKGRHHILTTTPEAFSETNADLLRRTAKAVGSSEGSTREHDTSLPRRRDNGHARGRGRGRSPSETSIVFPRASSCS